MNDLINIITRWNELAVFDLGTEINPITNAFATFFENAHINGVYENGEATTEGNSIINPILRGFAISNPYEELTVTECLDLNTISFTYDSLLSLDWYLMNAVGYRNHYNLVQHHKYMQNRKARRKSK